MDPVSGRLSVCHTPSRNTSPAITERARSTRASPGVKAIGRGPSATGTGVRRSTGNVGRGGGGGTPTLVPGAGSVVAGKLPRVAARRRSAR